jgi:hypothetical protein
MMPELNSLQIFLVKIFISHGISGNPYRYPSSKINVYFLLAEKSHKPAVYLIPDIPAMPYPPYSIPAGIPSSASTKCLSNTPCPLMNKPSIDRNVFKLWKVISPVEDVLRISYSGNQEYFQLQMRVYNSQGMQVKKITQTLQANMEILVSDLAPGI